MSAATNPAAALCPCGHPAECHDEIGGCFVLVGGVYCACDLSRGDVAEALDEALGKAVTTCHLVDDDVMEALLAVAREARAWLATGNGALVNADALARIDDAIARAESREG